MIPHACVIPHILITRLADALNISVFKIGFSDVQGMNHSTISTLQIMRVWFAEVSFRLGAFCCVVLHTDAGYYVGLVKATDGISLSEVWNETTWHLIKVTDFEDAVAQSLHCVDIFSEDSTHTLSQNNYRIYLEVYTSKMLGVLRISGTTSNYQTSDLWYNILKTTYKIAQLYNTESWLDYAQQIAKHYPMIITP